jgi:hypothetical protein
MKIVDGIDTTKKAAELTESEREDYFTKLVMGKDVTEEFETNRGKFTIKYPKPNDLITIGRIMAFRRDYKPIEAFDTRSEEMNLVTATLDTVVVSGPEWFENAKKSKSNFSFVEVPSRAFLFDLYVKAHSFRGIVDSILEKGEGTDDSGVPAERGIDAPVDGGAFGGLSSE